MGQKRNASEKQEYGMNKSRSEKNIFSRHYEAQAKAQCNTCSAGTWVINREHHLYKTRKERGFFLKNFIKRMMRTKEEGPTVSNEAKQTTPSTNATRNDCKILILCKGCTFSEDMMEYAIDMAAKTKSSLVALNLDEQGTNFSSFCSESEKNICNFSDKATKAGLSFAHVVEQGAED